MRQSGPVVQETEKTDRNIKQATARSLWFGSMHIEWKFWTGICAIRPIRISVSTWFFNEGFVRWRRLYWLTFGISITTPLHDVDQKMNVIERRLYHDRD